MSPIRPSKRRRIDASTHTLSQPFKSPFKTPRTAPSTTSSPTKENTITSSPPKQGPATISPTKLIPANPLTIPQPTTTETPQHRSHSTTTNTSTTTLPALRTQHTHLLNNLSTARSTLETSTQALTIESSPRHAELQSLIQTWKLASRAAAEEVFAKARDRVNKMGGVGAMRERERSRKMGNWGWDEGEGGKVQGERGEEVGEDGTGWGGEVRDEREEGESRVQEEEVADEEGGYTMDMMLKSLNIELGVIGFDRGLQRWVD